MLQERRREFSLKSPGIKPQASVSTRHNLASSQSSVSGSTINGGYSAASSMSSLIGSVSTLSSRRHVPSNLAASTNGGNQLDDDMDVDSLSSGTSTPMTDTPTTDNEFNMDDDTSVFHHSNSSISTNTSGFISS